MSRVAVSLPSSSHEKFLAHLSRNQPDPLEFRIGEAPLLLNASFKDKMLNACESMIDVMLSPDFRARTESTIPDSRRVPNENAHTSFLVFDFGICEDGLGGIEPQLVELQGFASNISYSTWHNEVTKEHFDIPPGYSPYFNGLNKDSYLDLLKETIVGPHSPENVILLEIYPFKQKTRPDFYCTIEQLGIDAVCLTELEQEGKKLYRRRKDGAEEKGERIQVKRIYLRVLFEDITPNLESHSKIFWEELDVEWVGHPNWFYRISKFILPFFDLPNVPKTQFLHQVPTLPEDLENYVVKPIFTYGGKGVIIDVSKEEVERIEERRGWILQRKARYCEDALGMGSPSVKGEIRVLYLWPDNAERPTAALSFVRFSQGSKISLATYRNTKFSGLSTVFYAGNTSESA